MITRKDLQPLTNKQLGARLRKIRAQQKSKRKRRHDLQVFGGPNWIQKFNKLTFELEHLALCAEDIAIERDYRSKKTREKNEKQITSP